MSRVGTRPVTRHAVNRQNSKAQYHPVRAATSERQLANVASIVGRLHQKRVAAGQALAARRATENAPAGSLVRDGYTIPSDPEVAAAIGDRSAYLQETGIEADFLRTMRALLEEPDLPYNPYPTMMHHTLAQSERLHMLSRSREDILSSISNKVMPTPMPYVFQVAGKSGFCGLKSLMRVVEPASLQPYHWMLHSLTPSTSTIETHEDYSIQVVVALVGECVFSGTFYQRPPVVKIRTAFIISGQSVDEAIPLFINSVLKDIFYVENAGHHVLFGIWLPGGTSVQDGASVLDEDSWWTLDDVQDSKEEFWSALYRTTVSSRLIHVKGYFRSDEHLSIYQPGEKQYELVFIEVDPETGKEIGVTSFTEHPMLTVHEGAFIKKTDMEAYLGSFAPQMLPGDRMAESSPDPGDGSCDNLAERWPSRTRIHGFRYGTESEYSPYAPQIMAPIRTSLQKLIATSQPAADLMNLVYAILLLVLIDRKVYSADVLVQLCQILQSTAAKLSYLQNLNECLQRLILRMQGEVQSELVTSLYIRYKQELEDLLCNDDSSLQTVGHIVRQHLMDIVETESGFSQMIPLSEATVKNLSDIHTYCQTVFVLLAEACLKNAPAVEKVVASVKETYPELAVKPRTHLQATKERIKGLQYTGQYIDVKFKHGFEDTDMVEHDHMVLNRATCIERDNAPALVSVDSVLMKYIVDTRLDEVWQNYLAEILSGPHLPSKPHARLVVTLRQAAMRMELGYMSDLRIMEKVMHRAARIEDADNYVHHIPGCDVHGISTALSVLDVSSFNKIIPLLQVFISKDFIQKRRPYRVAVCCAASGDALLYGAMMPYLLSITLQEHGYIRGPDGRAGEAMQLYARIVYEHLHQLNTQGAYPIVAVFFGEELHYSIEEVIQNKSRFMAEMETFCKRKETIMIKAYIQYEWRYVSVNKYLNFHFITDDETKCESYFPPDPASLYQNVFLDKEKSNLPYAATLQEGKKWLLRAGGCLEQAAFHFQFGGPQNQSDPLSAINLREATKHLDVKIVTAERCNDFLVLYRYLLTRNLIHQGTSQTAEIWRMLHSVAAQIEYVNTLRAALQELVHHVLMLREKTNVPNVSQPSMDNENTAAGSVSLSLLDQMAAGFREKLLSVCSQQATLTARSLPDVVMAKLSEVIVRNDVTKQLTIRISAETITALMELGTMLRCLQDTTSYDIHCGCPAVQACLRSLRIESQESTR